MIKNVFRGFERKEWILYGLSLFVVVGSNFFSNDVNFINILSSILGVTTLIFIAKGRVFGQVMAVAFGVVYSLSALRLRYYSEIVTHFCMSVPIAVFSIIAWLKNPSGNTDGAVKIRKFSIREILVLFVLTSVVTLAFYFILQALNTPNLMVATISVATGFAAAYLLLRRISWYAVAYVLNDIILIVLWSIASLENLENLTMVACFIMFLLNDSYAFIRWKLREKQQMLKK